VAPLDDIAVTQVSLVAVHEDAKHPDERQVVSATDHRQQWFFKVVVFRPTESDLVQSGALGTCVKLVIYEAQ
jgi:hypothetical protein